jgi:hypothetical protein
MFVLWRQERHRVNPETAAVAATGTVPKQ